MKIIEAMKKIKANRVKIADLQAKISATSAHLSFETSPYDSPSKKVDEWSKSCCDLTRDCIKLLTAISRTNLETKVPIEIGEKTVTKTIAEWIWRRREFAALERKTFEVMTDRNLQEGTTNTSTGQPMEVKIVRNYDIELRDKKITDLNQELAEIDAALEIANATVELLGVTE